MSWPINQRSRATSSGHGSWTRCKISAAEISFQQVANQQLRDSSERKHTEKKKKIILSSLSITIKNPAVEFPFQFWRSQTQTDQIPSKGLLNVSLCVIFALYCFTIPQSKRHTRFLELCMAQKALWFTHSLNSTHFLQLKRHSRQSSATEGRSLVTVASTCARNHTQLFNTVSRRADIWRVRASYQRPPGGYRHATIHNRSPTSRSGRSFDSAQ